MRAGNGRGMGECNRKKKWEKRKEKPKGKRKGKTARERRKMPTKTNAEIGEDKRCKHNSPIPAGRTPATGC